MFFFSGCFRGRCRIACIAIVLNWSKGWLINPIFKILIKGSSRFLIHHSFVYFQDLFLIFSLYRKKIMR